MESMKIKKVDHVVLTSNCVEDCLLFYKKLGFLVVDEGVRFGLYIQGFKLNVHTQGKELHPHAHLAKPGTLDLCFEIGGSLDVWMKNLHKQDIETTRIEIKHGASGEMHSFYVRDPDQNLIEFCSYE